MFSKSLLNNTAMNEVEYLTHERYKINNLNILIYAQSPIRSQNYTRFLRSCYRHFYSSLATSVFSSPLGSVDLQNKKLSKQCNTHVQYTCN